MSLVLNSLSLRRNKEIHLDNVSLMFDRGCLTTVLGRTLSGKTTIMRTIAGLQDVDKGTLSRDGRSFGKLPAWQRDVAMVYQQFINYPHLSVFENVAFPLRKRKVAQNEIDRRVRGILETVGLDAFHERKPAQLSGGQQQRVALARALVRKAEVLLLDEPLVNLDYKLREQLRGGVPRPSGEPGRCNNRLQHHGTCRSHDARRSARCHARGARAAIWRSRRCVCQPVIGTRGSHRYRPAHDDCAGAAVAGPSRVRR